MTENKHKQINDIFKKESFYEDEVIFNESLRVHTTMGSGGKTDIWYEPSSAKKLFNVIRNLVSCQIKFRVVGNGSNILFSDDVFDGVIISLKNSCFRELQIEKNRVIVGAGCGLAKVISECLEAGLSGLEGLTGIPATVGGAIKLNASYISAISDNIVRILVFNGEKVEWVDKVNINFEYRKTSFKDTDIVLGAEFSLKNDDKETVKKRILKYSKEKVEKQPMGEKTLGCIFKNPNFQGALSAGEYIDRAGLKGETIGDAAVSHKHANFIINRGMATSSEIFRLMIKIKDVVNEKFSVILNPEVEIW